MIADRLSRPRALRGLLPLALLLGAIPAAAREVVVFRDHRSLVVSSHRVSTTWTYLAVEGGEIAVPTKLIAEIRNEGGEVGKAVPLGAMTGPAPAPARVAEEPPPPPREDEMVPPYEGAPAEGDPPPPEPKPSTPPQLQRYRDGGDAGPPGSPQGLPAGLPNPIH